MRLKVLRYNLVEDYHEVCDEDGNKIRVDLMVDGGYKGKPENLVGKEVEIETYYPYLLLASGVVVLQSTSDDARTDWIETKEAPCAP